jgi:glycerate-2-kinase
MTNPLTFADHPQHINHMIQTALAAADPADALSRHWSLDAAGPIYLVAAGKASLEMALQAFDLCNIADSAIACVPERLAERKLPPKLKAYPASHPLPDATSVHAAQQIAQIARTVSTKPGATYHLSRVQHWLSCYRAAGLPT